MIDRLSKEEIRARWLNKEPSKETVRAHWRAKPVRLLIKAMMREKAKKAKSET